MKIDDILKRIEIDEKINEIVQIWISNEIKWVPSDVKLEHSIILNLYWFNLASLATDEGKLSLTSLLTPNEKQAARYRMNVLSDTLYMALGKKYVETVLKTDSLDVFKQYMPAQEAEDLFAQNNSIWVLPLIQRVGAISSVKK